MKVQSSNIEGSAVFIVDNIFSNPHKIKDYLVQNEPSELWKHKDRYTRNGSHFIDKRHFINDVTLEDFFNFIETTSGQVLNQKELYSNYTLFKDRKFNDYQNNYWYPHRDLGYNAIVYLNSEENAGTNLYSDETTDTYKGPEHLHPWRPKSFYKVLYTSTSVFNRLFMFDGKKFLHGMAVNNDTHFNSFRLNVVTFLK